ncbi:MAG: glycosyltransferase family 4 protein [Halarcobacter sp.]
MKIVFVHDWFITSAGAEKCVKSFNNIFTHADIYTLFDYFKEDDRKDILNNKKTKTSFLQYFPLAKKYYRYLLPFYPFAIEQLDINKYDLVLSSSHAVAKGVITNHNQLHICYIHTPMRYAWDLSEQYLEDNNLKKGIKGRLVQYILKKIKIWDLETINRVDYFIANSNFVANRVKKIYNRDSIVIYPPVDINKFQLDENKEDFYITAGRMVSYKKIDLIVEAFSKTNKILYVIGDGPDLLKIKAKASSNMKILGFQEDEVLIKMLQKAKAFVYAAIEDFGILPVEAQACGTPVICLNQGGTRETVIDGVTGVYFQEQNTKSILNAIEKFEKNISSFIPSKIRKHTLQFSKERFEKEIKEFVFNKYNEFKKRTEKCTLKDF